MASRRGRRILVDAHDRREAERRHRCGGDAADEADDDGRMQVGNEDIHQGDDDEADDADFSKAAQPVLSVELPAAR